VIYWCFIAYSLINGNNREDLNDAEMVHPRALWRSTKVIEMHIGNNVKGLVQDLPAQLSLLPAISKMYTL